ncbi:hypothetical protein FB565_008263 [Actinoplanes lutulentus]|uniref:Uncharacterized protein DUF1707 n=1 Tax=Actinoplanes lutulentus TaxID=1287878 RepID=A0A327Z7Y1_9ACTN|nr:DUF1707 domain-containing protein [Actinoplanes lutulentus]MBB2948480.1 hypothetical protein [Actinoplanes lutulentus]RAK34488.1 uncharacterized protein DUF1707 [Actinoplanes lutulentus]
MTVPVPAPISDGDRERVAELLQRACGDGRLTLEEFSVRVGTVWAAEDPAELAKAYEGVAPTPVVGSSRTVEKVITVFSQTSRRGRWRLRDSRLGTYTVFGQAELDLRHLATGEDVVEITGSVVFGQLKVIVPEGVEVDLTGPNVFSQRDMRLAAKPRLPGTPEIRVHVTSWFANVEVVSSPPELPGR